MEKEVPSDTSVYNHQTESLGLPKRLFPKANFKIIVHWSYTMIASSFTKVQLMD